MCQQEAGAGRGYCAGGPGLVLFPPVRCCQAPSDGGLQPLLSARLFRTPEANYPAVLMKGLGGGCWERREEMEC